MRIAVFADALFQPLHVPFDEVFVCELFVDIARIRTLVGRLSDVPLPVDTDFLGIGSCLIARESSCRALGMWISPRSLSVDEPAPVFAWLLCSTRPPRIATTTFWLSPPGAPGAALNSS